MVSNLKMIGGMGNTPSLQIAPLQSFRHRFFASSVIAALLVLQHVENTTHGDLH